MNKKYEMIKEPGTRLRRIRALRDFSYQNFFVKKGDLGGLIESESNLSQEDSCWIYATAQVSGAAKISGNAMVSGYARVFGRSDISGSARVFGEVSGDALVFGDAVVREGTRVFGKKKLHLHPDLSRFG